MLNEMESNNINIVERALEVFRSEQDEIDFVASHLDDTFRKVVELILHSNGKVVISGIGKTGLIGRKIAASLASTGTQAIFLNAAEAQHGDLGMVSRGDIVILISNSGESEEIVRLPAPLKRLNCTLVAMTGMPKSTLAQQCDYVLNVGVRKEACKIGLAPTTSTTATLVMGDALTVCLMEARNFRPENFALYHPGGALGRRMLTHVSEVMGTVVPTVSEATTFRDVLVEVSSKKLGMTLVGDNNGSFTGIITDGDIRRVVQRVDDFQQLKAGDFMTKGFKSIDKEKMVNDALDLMNRHKITTLAVTDGEGDNAPIIGILHIHDIYGFTKNK
ncbi:MAG: KpsF/GutQ family sugar-phosphate isomerase [Paludibacteraceae bacterium]|nr:KpsF/GutQ family sugar-phosphate isomerase [Paludibacteraceae bacterium]